jgi:hypothetical protein
MIGISHLNPLPDSKHRTYAILKEKIITDYSGFLIYTNIFLFDEYMDTVMYLVESGIIEKIAKTYVKKDEPKDDENVALSIDHLLIWFQLWAALLLIAVLFFLVEIFVAKVAKILMKKAVKALKELWNNIEEIY